ncbi:hypothetical protein [Candidatus Rariloculus sp.]|uniref:hypothetical protein n=1 Tax=Candidatus Rariloculus sp. TaxID=3101265 RepID=UPI003D0E14C6
MREALVALVRRKLRERSLSARAAALREGLPIRRIQGVLEGHSPTLDNAEELCRALGLEFYIGEPRERYDPVKVGAVSPEETSEKVPVWPVSDEQLWQLIGAFADEWEAADAAGKEKLEIRFAAQFPELVKGTGK